MPSVLDVFQIGIGPSSSHTMAPMRIAKDFLERCRSEGSFESINTIQVALFGSLALTGSGHGTFDAIILGLEGDSPRTTSLAECADRLQQIRSTRRLRLLGLRLIDFDPRQDIVFPAEQTLSSHPNGIAFTALNSGGTVIAQCGYYSVGGGAFVSAPDFDRGQRAPEDISGSWRYENAEALLDACQKLQMGIDAFVLRNEAYYRPESETIRRLDEVAAEMNACIDRGLRTRGTLPGGLKVARRAPDLHQKLLGDTNESERLFDRLNVYAMAVNEENAAGGRVVTAPTNGAAGIIPSVLRTYVGTNEEALSLARRFLLVAGAIGLLFKTRASISGAEMGCQGEVGVACSMSAGGLAAIWGGTAAQIERAAEIGIEHNLGLTCDPIGGLVQIPCIERNAIAAVKAASAARLAIRCDSVPKVRLDQAIETMRQTGEDMNNKYKETSKGGLAVNFVAC